MKNKDFFENINFRIFFISLTIFLIKWSFSFYHYGPENSFLKFLFNSSGDFSYYPFVHQLSNFTLNEGYSNLSSDLNFIGFPYLISLFHATLYKLIGLYSFFFLELICIFIFFKIFFHIFKILNFTNNICILISLILFTIPNLLYLINNFDNLIDIFHIPYVFNLKQLYSSFYGLRFPRPLLTNLVLFSFLLFLIKFYLNIDFLKKEKFLYISSFLLGILFNSFFFYFIVCFFLFCVLIIFDYKTLIFKKTNILFFSKIFLILFIISSPFLIQILLIEQDYFARVGTIDLNNFSKIFLYQHFSKGLIKLEFIIIFFFNLVLYFINIKLDSKNKKFINFFWLLFASSIITPYIYLFFINKITFFGNFTSMVAMFSFLLLKINLIVLFLSIKNYYKINFQINNRIFYFIIIFFVFINSAYYFKTSRVDSLTGGSVHFTPKNQETFRKDFSDVILFLESNANNENELLLTNDIHTQLWWIFSDKKKYYFPYVFFVALDDDIIEKQLISAFKYLKLNEDDFISYFNENKITDWRVVNSNNYFFLGHLKYQANYITEISNINNFPEATRPFIMKKSIHHTNQVILSKTEINRLRSKFSSLNKNIKLEPNIIVIVKDGMLTKNLKELYRYSISYENKNFIILLKK